MKKGIKKIYVMVAVFALLCFVAPSTIAVIKAETATAVEAGTETTGAEMEAADGTQEGGVVGDKAMAAAIAVGLAAGAGAIGMGMAIAKSLEAISRQPEAEGKIRTTLMLGLVFVETAIIYALVIAILIIFVL
jgi:F-type H+-transporting ATPase subunit c